MADIVNFLNSIRLLMAIVIILLYYSIYKFTDEINLDNSIINNNKDDNVLFKTEQYSVLSKVARDNIYFTEGLSFDSDNGVIESSGLYGQSFVHKFYLNDTSKDVFRINLDSKYFGEGSTMFKNKLYVLTWKERAV